MFDKFKSYSPVKQDMIWIAEYDKDNYLSEFNFENKKENSFYDIEQDEVNRFGLIGGGYKMYFDKNSGQFNICNRQYDIGYKLNNTIYLLTKQELFPRDIITYKQAVSEINGQMNTPQIVSYYFGYKTEFTVDDITFNFKPIICVPINQPVYIDIHLVANKDLEGELLFIKNNKIMDTVYAPLTKDVAGGMQWILR